MRHKVVSGLLFLLAPLCAQAQLPPTPPPRATAPAPLKKVSETVFEMGRIRIDTKGRELVVPGRLNDVRRLEFLANMEHGSKDYESAVTLYCDAITFNAALLLIGLDPANAVPSKKQFDRDTPKGDPVDLFVTFGGKTRVRIEQLALDTRSKKTLAEGPWVYTGGTFLDWGDEKKYLPQIDGVLIGLMHGPSSIIENPRNDAVGGFGAVVLNPTIGFPAGTPLTLTVKSLKPQSN